MAAKGDELNADPGLVHKLKGLKDVALDMDFVSKTSQLAIASNDNTVFVWVLENPNNIRAYKCVI